MGLSKLQEQSKDIKYIELNNYHTDHYVTRKLQQIYKFHIKFAVVKVLGSVQVTYNVVGTVGVTSS